MSKPQQETRHPYLVVRRLANIFKKQKTKKKKQKTNQTKNKNKDKCHKKKGEGKLPEKD